MVIRSLLGILVMVLALTAPVWAEPPAASCEEQLLVKTTHDQLLMQKRAEAEDQLALVAARAQVLERKLQLVTKELVDLKAKLAALEKPAEPDKPKE